MRYDPKSIELKWQKRWLKGRTYEPDLLRAKGPFYNLMMFPYPSAEGLHVGNMYAFTGADIHGRFQRMQGHGVFEPIGLDGFGIHSENYAIKINKHPADQAKVSEKNFYRQLRMIGNGFAWDERLETYDPAYYRWTQWIFTEMFRRGLAYRKKSPVNWCPSCKTVLADEQVISGECERCGTKVTRRDLEQWFFRITKYAPRLLKNLERIDWSKKIKIAQKNWIGRSEGALIKFQITNSKSQIEVFTTRPDTLFGATYMVLAPEHPIIQNLESRIQNREAVRRYVRRARDRKETERTVEDRAKTGLELKGIEAINPASGKTIPIWVADYVLGHVGTGAIMAVPAHDQRDFAFAKKYKLPVTIVVCPHYPKTTCPILTEAYTGSGHLVASEKFDGMDSGRAKWAITKAVGGKRVAQYRLRDWLISRQRYWGPPIPLVFCENCAERIKRQEAGVRKIYTKGELENPGWIAVPEKDLPVKLPYVKKFRPTGTDKSPLATVERFWKVCCPKCGASARRETDVSDTFLDSAWYYLRYPSIRSTRSGKAPWDPAITKKWFPVDMYIGGAEHAVLHLLYVRFLAMVFHDWGLLPGEEPFKKFRAHGLLISSGAKMSKSRGNVVNPDDYIRAYGADALRMYLMFLGPFDEGGDFRDTGIRGITRFLERTWRFVQARSRPTFGSGSALDGPTHRTVAKVTADITELRYNTAISALMVLLNAFEANPEAVAREHISAFLRLLAPFAPHITEELWHGALGEKGSIHHSRWPEADPRFLRKERDTVVIQVNGRVRDRIEVAPGQSEAALRALALERPKVREAIGGRPVRKFIYVPGRIANIVF